MSVPGLSLTKTQRLSTAKVAARNTAAASRRSSAACPSRPRGSRSSPQPSRPRRGPGENPDRRIRPDPTCSVGSSSITTSSVGAGSFRSWTSAGLAVSTLRLVVRRRPGGFIARIVDRVWGSWLRFRPYGFPPPGPVDVSVAAAARGDASSLSFCLGLRRPACRQSNSLAWSPTPLSFCWACAAELIDVDGAADLALDVLLEVPGCAERMRLGDASPAVSGRSTARG